MIVFDNEDIIARVKTQNGTSDLLDVLCNETYQTLFSSHSSAQNQDLWTEWNLCLGHFNIQNVKKLARISMSINA